MFHHRKLPDYATLLSGPTPPDGVGFQSTHLQIWYNHTNASWVGEGEQPHQHLHSDECFIVLRGSLVVVRNPDQNDHQLRRMSITDYGGKRSQIAADADHASRDWPSTGANVG